MTHNIGFDLFQSVLEPLCFFFTESDAYVA